MKLKLAAAALGLSAALLLSGCSSVRNASDGFDASIVDPYVTLNATTEADVRALLGTPTVEGVLAEDGSRVFGYGITTQNKGAVFARNLGKSALTLGLGSDKREFTQKNILFKVNADGVVVDYKKTGVSYLLMHRFTVWNECERCLSDEEVNSPVRYSDIDICNTYAAEMAAKKGIKIEDVDLGEEYEGCNIPCQTTRDLAKTFGKLKSYDQLVDEKPGDGSKSDLLF